MDAITLRTPHDFEGSDSHKRKRHSTIACECCRRLKTRCQGGESNIASPDATPRPCDHCASLGKQCEWPPEDGRKLKRNRQMSSTSTTSGNSLPLDKDDLQSFRLGLLQPAIPEDTGLPPNGPTSGAPVDETSDQSNGYQAPLPSGGLPNNWNDSSNGETEYFTVSYFRHLGPTGIVPGHKKISLKARREERDPSRLQSGGQHGAKILPLFDEETDLPVKELLPILIEKYFEYYSGIYYFTNRAYLESLVQGGTPPIFLVSVISALASRFVDHELYTPYFPPALNGRERESWEYSIPFLEKAKSMVMSALSLPTADVAAGLLMLAFADFGDNNEVSF